MSINFQHPKLNHSRMIKISAKAKRFYGAEIFVFIQSKQKF